MKAMLSSSGFTTPELVQACVDLCGKPKEEISFAVINEAYAVELGDKRWVLNDLSGIADNFGGKIDMVNLLALPIEEVEARINACDALYVVGGHTDYLMYVFQETGFDRLLTKLLKKKVYVGSSAGSMVMGNRVSTAANTEMYGEGDNYGTKYYMGMTSFAIKPHLGSTEFPKNRPEYLDKLREGLKVNLYGIQDDAAICIDGDRQYVVGSEPYLVEAE